jgi:flagellar motor switch protein FliG
MNSAEKGIFINGKKQIIEMLQFMPNAEREKLLQNLKMRNPSMAKELSEKSFSFEDIFRLDRDFLAKVLNQINPTIIGLALYNTTPSNQRTALQLIQRSNAERAFHVMNQDLSGKKVECSKAQSKIVSYAITLSRKKEINL